MTAIQTYADFTVSCRDRVIPADAMHHAKRCVIDTLAATLPGGVVAPTTLLIEALGEDIGHGRASLLPSGLKTTARTAALINGSAAHTIEFDDIFRDGLYHPGAPIIPAALAAAEATGASGETLLRGVIAGYEVSNRIARAVNPAHYDYWHTTATVGFFGTAAAAALILGLNEKQTAHAIATVGTFAAGLQQAFRADAMSKPLHSGRAAEGGVMAAQAAKAGVTGALDILEGERGFGNGMSRDVDWDAAVAGLGEEWTITRMTQKNHSACGHMHAAIDAVVELTNANSLTADKVREIRVGSYQKSHEICGNSDPKTPYEAKFSMAYCLGQALLTGQGCRMAAFTPERLNDPVLRAEMAKVVHTIDEGCEAAFPRARSAKVEIELTDGTALFHHAPTRKGDPDAPLSDAELDEKFADLAAMVMRPERAAELLSALHRLEELPSLEALSLGTIGDRAAQAAE